jgi:hypothetical protein
MLRTQIRHFGEKAVCEMGSEKALAVSTHARYVPSMFGIEKVIPPQDDLFITEGFITGAEAERTEAQTPERNDLLLPYCYPIVKPFVSRAPPIRDLFERRSDYHFDDNRWQAGDQIMALCQRLMD